MNPGTPGGTGEATTATLWTDAARDDAVLCLSDTCTDSEAFLTWA